MKLRLRKNKLSIKLFKVVLYDTLTFKLLEVMLLLEAVILIINYTMFLLGVDLSVSERKSKMFLPYPVLLCLPHCHDINSVYVWPIHFAVQQKLA